MRLRPARKPTLLELASLAGVRLRKEVVFQMQEIRLGKEDRMLSRLDV